MSKKRRTRTIRLQCSGDCEREDHDGITKKQFAAAQVAWCYVEEFQSYEDSLKDEGSPFDWQTHTGLCPDCRASDLKTEYDTAVRRAVAYEKEFTN